MNCGFELTNRFHVAVRLFSNRSQQEKMRGQRRRLPVQPLGYVMSRKVIFRRAEVSVLLEVCFPRRPHEGQPRSLHVMSVKVDLTFVDQNDFQKRGK